MKTTRLPSSLMKFYCGHFRCFYAVLVQVMLFSERILHGSASLSEEKILESPMLCNGPVARYQTGKYIIHNNSTHHLRIATELGLDLDLGHTSCFQVDLKDRNVEENATNTEADSSVVTSVFYAFTYQEYVQNYRFSDYFDFGIPEFSSHCTCDCPGSDSFCTHHFDQKFCTKGEICVQKYFTSQQTYGCPKSSKSGSANMCCEISLRPYQDRKFRAVKFTVPYIDVHLKIDIFIFYEDKWLPFRTYRERIDPTQPSKLKLNGGENIADMKVEASTGNSVFNLDIWNRYYFYELDKAFGEEFKLLDSPMQTNTNTGRSRTGGYDFLLFDSNRWTTGGGTLRLYETHRPTVSNCKGQTYTDKFLTDAPTYVIRNSSGAVNFSPKEGKTIQELHAVHVKRIQLIELSDARMIQVFLQSRAVPKLGLKIFLQQKMKIISHVHLSHFSAFSAEIRLDKHKNRYLNVTLKNAFGQFGITLYKDQNMKKKDVEISAITKLPFSSNYSDYLPLPNHISDVRYVCVSAYELESRRKCQWAKFVSEPSETYVLSQFFIDNEGQCPGCNEAEDAATHFFSFFNPRKWFNGVNSISEGLALGLEIAFYVVIALLVIAIIRRLVWPLIRWALCVEGPRYQRAVCKSESDV